MTFYFFFLRAERFRFEAEEMRFGVLRVVGV